MLARGSVLAEGDYATVSANAAVREAYIPLLKDLQEIQKGLALDVNPAGVTAMKKPLDRAKTEAATLKTKIAALQAELTAIAGGMSGKAAPAK